jgi:hypothetical protein
MIKNKDGIFTTVFMMAPWIIAKEKQQKQKQHHCPRIGFMMIKAWTSNKYN